MPGFNRRGPMGQGPMTGRGMGYCTGYRSVQNENTDKSYTDTRYENEFGPEFFFGRGMRMRWGFGHGRGRGRGFGFCFGRWGAKRNWSNW